MLSERSSRRVRGAVTYVALSVSALLAFAGCASDSTASGETDGGTQVSAESAAAAVEEYKSLLERPTEITQTEPITNPIPEGKDIVFISCGMPTCELQGEIVAEAAEVLGWTSRTISTDGTPERYQQAFEQAIREDVDAVIYTAIEASVIQNQVAEGIEKGILFASASNVSVPDGVIINVSGPEGAYSEGEVLATAVAGEAQGQPSKSLLLDLASYEIVDHIIEGYEGKLESLTPGSEVTVLEIPNEQIADAPNLIVSALRADPEIEYVAATNGVLLTGVPAALEAQGIEASLASTGSTTENLQYVSNGQQVSDSPWQYYENDYLMIDALAREFAGQEVLDVEAPWWIVTEESLPTASEVFPMVEDYKEQFAALWGKND